VRSAGSSPACRTARNERKAKQQPCGPSAGSDRLAAAGTPAAARSRALAPSAHGGSARPMLIMAALKGGKRRQRRNDTAHNRNGGATAAATRSRELTAPGRAVPGWAGPGWAGPCAHLDERVVDEEHAVATHLGHHQLQTKPTRGALRAAMLCVALTHVVRRMHPYPA
jgi:hypothetical protein